jgi:hypothetical protein
MGKFVTGAVLVLGCGLLLGAALRAEAQAEKEPKAAAVKGAWIHIQVDEKGEGGAKVSVNLPIGAAEAALDVVQSEALEHGKLHMGHGDLKVADLRRIWNEIRTGGNADLVTVEEKDQTVKVTTHGERVLVEVTDKAKGATKVKLDLPAAAVDALFAGEGESLDVKAALAELKLVQGDLVEVHDDDAHVRVWID